MHDEIRKILINLGIKDSEKELIVQLAIELLKYTLSDKQDRILLSGNSSGVNYTVMIGDIPKEVIKGVLEGIVDMNNNKGGMKC